jgi:hypothetical protein
MEHFLDSQLPFKAEVYEVFRQHPELLVAEEEGLSKGGRACGCTGLCRKQPHVLVYWAVTSY